jgi:hypothetical protein
MLLCGTEGGKGSGGLRSDLTKCGGATDTDTRAWKVICGMSILDTEVNMTSFFFCLDI